MHETYPYPCMKPPKHESMPETPCDMRYTNSLTPSPTAAIPLVPSQCELSRLGQAISILLIDGYEARGS